MQDDQADHSRDAHRFNTRDRSADRLTQGLAATTCAALDHINRSPHKPRINKAIIEVEALRHHEGVAPLSQRSARHDDWTIHIEPISTTPETLTVHADESTTIRQQVSTISIRLIMERIAQRTPPAQQTIPMPSAAPPAATAPARLDLPATSVLGPQAWLSIFSNAPICEQDAPPLRELAEHIGRWLWRYQCAWAWSQRHGQPRALIGESQAIRELERCIAIAASADLPAHIVGVRGSPIDLIAHAIHDSSPRWASPLIETDVPTLIASSVRFRSTLTRALHSSLLVRHPASAPPGELNLIIERLIAWFPETLAPAAIPRLILVDEHDRLTPERAASIAAAAAPLGGVLSVAAPPLHARTDDLPALLMHLCERYQIDPNRLTNDALNALRQALSMPGDQLSFERLIARLAMIDPQSPIDASIIAPLIERCAGAATIKLSPPTLPASSPGAAARSTIEPKPLAAGAASWPPEQRTAEDPLAADMLDGNLDPSIHEAVRRAIAWAAANHPNDISTPDAAHAACVSSSHLAHLLKAELGTSFRLLLARLRIERARRLLVEKPARSITDIALDVGFGDLSHFIKSFNRFTGATPREYRRRALAYAQWRAKQTPGTP